LIDLFCIVQKLLAIVFHMFAKVNFL
jgi:hypothetical protein